jgi:hypothetical protein
MACCRLFVCLAAYYGALDALMTRDARALTLQRRSESLSVDADAVKKEEETMTALLLDGALGDMVAM